MALPDGVVAEVEQQARLVQGKGGGAGSAVEEARSALSLLPVHKRVNPLALDVGANVGDWGAALLTCAPDARLVCFEPSQSTFRILRDRFTGLPNVQLECRAVGLHSGSAEIWAESEGSGLASLTRRRLDHYGVDVTHSESVEVVSLDDWLLESKARPDIVKLDIEGHEFDALRGGREVIGKASVVQFEFGGCNIDTRTFFQDFYYYFHELHFDLFRLGPRGLVLVSQYNELDEAFQTTNYFAVARKS